MKKTLALILMLAIHDARDKWLASWPEDFEWSSTGEVLDTCIKVKEGAEPLWFTWRDNYLCWKGDEDLGFKWSSSGRLDGMRCTPILEPADPHTWFDNYLCVEYDSPYHFSWSYAGKIQGKSCISWNEPSEKAYWEDNYLCAPETNSAGFPDPEFPTHFKWSNQGEPNGYNCISIDEPGKGAYRWDDNHFCWERGTKNPEIEWSNNGMIFGKRCTRILETDKYKTYYDNFLCVPRSSPLHFLWSHSGIPEDTTSYIQWNEPASNNWHDNYLYIGNPGYEDPVFPDDFKLSHNGVPKGYHCIAIWHRLWDKDNKGQTDSHFCWRHEKKDPEIEWSINGYIDGMRCVNLYEPHHHSLSQRLYLCVPESSPLRFDWSYDGKLKDANCMNWRVTYKYSKAWSDNYLCEDKCTMHRMEVLDSARLTRERESYSIIGLVRAAVCVGSGEEEISLSSGREVEQTVEVGSSKTSETNWGVSVSIEFGAELLGFDSTVTLTKSVGGSTSWEHSETKSFSEVSAKEGSFTKKFNSPGGALIIGFVERYKIDESQVPARMHYQCPSGNNYSESSTVEVKASSYSVFSYKGMSGGYYQATCEDDLSVTKCVNDLNEYYGFDVDDYTEVEEAFVKCFDDGKGYIFET